MAKRTRSPNYPMIGIKAALERADKLRQEYQRHYVPIGDAQKHLGYKENSSAGNQCIAALSAFGFIEITGKGSNREVKVSDTAFKILHETDESAALLQQAAFGPGLYKELWEKFNTPDGLAPDPTIRKYLVVDRNFNENAVDSFIEDFRASMDHANADSGTDEEHDKDLDKEKEKNRHAKRRRIKPPEGQQEAIFPLEEGDAVIQFPSRLSPDSFEDFKSWINLIVNKAKRSVCTDLHDDGRDLADE